MNLSSKDNKFLGRDVPAIPIEIVDAKDSYLIAKDGKKYIDFVMGWNVGNIGWGQKEVKDAIKNFNGPTYVNPYYLYEPWAELAELLATITPPKLTKTFRATGGTEAVEIALQAAMAFTGREEFISIEGSYHGHSIGAMSVGMSYFSKFYKNLRPKSHKIPLPLDKNAAEKVEQILKSRKIAAFIAEPVICNLGVVIPHKEFFEIVAKVCKKYKTLLIMDEVATGFGRTGKMFASEHYQLEPDIMTLAKGLTGGYGALGATIMSEEVAKSLEFNFSVYSTFGWQPLNVQATLANLKLLLKNKEKIFKNVEKMSRLFQQRLNAMKFKFPAEIRIKGLAIGVEFNKEDYALKIVNRCREKGLLISLDSNNIFTIFPALNIDREVAEKGLSILEASL